MKKTLSSLAVAAVALFAAQATFAQAPTRAEVKKETAEANKSGSIPGTGMSNVPAAAAGQESPKAAAATTDTTRAERKKVTAEANKAGQISGTGGGNVPGAATGQESPKAAAATSDTTRAARKKATAEANKAGDIKSGEANIPAKDK